MSRKKTFALILISALILCGLIDGAAVDSFRYERNTRTLSFLSEFSDIAFVGHVRNSASGINYVWCSRDRACTEFNFQIDKTLFSNVNIGGAIKIRFKGVPPDINYNRITGMPQDGALITVRPDIPIFEDKHQYLVFAQYMKETDSFNYLGAFNYENGEAEFFYGEKLPYSSLISCINVLLVKNTRKR